MNVEIPDHARERMDKYGVSEALVLETLGKPDSIADTYGKRKIAQKKLNGYMLRVIFEEKGSSKVVVTIYKAKSGRYEI